MPPTSVNDVTSSLGKMSVSLDVAGKSKISRKAALADSWEDEADECSDTEPRDSGSASFGGSHLPETKPSAPASAPSESSVYAPSHMISYNRLSEEPSNVGRFPATTTGPEKRPEKSTAVAARLIAAGIGQKAPRRTQEQRDYDRAVRAQEKRKRDEARKAEDKSKLDKEQAQKAIWDD